MSQFATITCDALLTHAPDDVWRALTDPELIRRWWGATGDLRPVVGHRFTLDMGGWGAQQCEVTAVEPGELLAFTFGEGGVGTTVTWRLAPEGDGTRLFLEHAGWDLDTELGRNGHRGMGAGWPHVLPRVDAALG
ncbi:MAG: SRPBCC domain-containing protein [Micrococcales bacterium]|nr:SRPBCC domain-containing protein [Micrococcales bacterium]